jgi:hypothetical protein
MSNILHQIIAVHKGVAAQTLSAISEVHKLNQKLDLFAGQTREYKPKNDDGDKLPSENTVVQRNAIDVFKNASKILGKLFDSTAKRDYTNSVAKADVEIDGRILLKDAPVTHLLFLEKQAVDIRTLVTEIPVLDPAHRWERDVNSNLYRSNPIETVKTAKDEQHITVVQATKEHPAQTAKVVKDIPVGTWTTVKLSGAIPGPEKEKILERIDRVIAAIKFAREKANSTEVVETPPNGILGYIFE